MRFIRTTAALVAALGTLTISTEVQGRTSSGAVYTASNAAAGNEVLVFDRNADGTLTLVDAIDTGGNGSGDGLGNQGGLTMTGDGKFLLVVNAGSNDVSVFQIAPAGLVLRDRTASGGVRPISVTVSGRLVYVLNNGGLSGGADNVVGFKLSRDGSLTQIPSSTRALSATSVGPAQVSLSADASTFIVTEKMTNRVDAFAVDDDGLIVSSTFYASSGVTPFGFAFGKRDQFFVSEAFGGMVDASAISSYAVTGAATIGVISASVPATETAACWVAVSGDGRFLYTTNAGSGTITGYSIQPDGAIARLHDNGVTATTGGGVSDVGISSNGRYVYALRSGAGVIAGFRVQENGALTPAGSVLLPGGANGIVVR